MISERVKCENALIPPQQEIGLFAAEEETTLYDSIVSNPPYLVLKPNHNTSDDLADEMRKQVEFYRKSKLYSFSIEGMLNLYQLSIERMLQMLKPKGELGVICPSTLFADQSATNLRKHLLYHNKVRHITYFPEKAELFENNVTQATNIFFLQKSGRTDDISIEANGKIFNVNLNLIQELFPKNMEIPLISEKDWIILKKLSSFPPLRTIPTIRNRRGELDLTLNSRYITPKPTKHQLIRGKMITDKGIDRTSPEYVCEDFVYTKSSEYLKHDCGRVRLIGQNICNIDNRQRLRFAFCEPTDILGNSCNYLSADFDTLKKLNILLSSALLNWRFRLTSSNNHINNYELDELPIADLSQIDADISFGSQEALNEYVCNLFGLDSEETLYISEQ
jgi:Alw26I/Eco31I/Esp3I family type II restriction m6 adenine DNA methyltransferase